MDYTKDIQKTLAYIEENLYRELSLKKIARIAGFSEYHFQKIFKKQLGMTVYKYIQKRRIANASWLLLHSDYRIIEIAGISGFSSQEAFSRVFKEYYHFPPRQYRVQFKNLFRRNEKMGDSMIKGWIISGSNFGQYRIEVDKDHFHSGQQSVQISRESVENTAEDFATVMQQINAENYRGKRIRLSAYLKSEEIQGAGGLWLRIDGDQFKQLKLDNMQDRPIVGTNDWNYYSSVLDVSDEAKIINFGFLLIGTGKIWADDFQLEIVTKDVATTDIKFEEAYPKEPKNLSFEED